MMKNTLDPESKEALVAYRLERAQGTLQEAQLLAGESFFNAAINRLYYGCYYAAVALLLKHNHPTQTHSGVKTLLGLHFVSKGILSIEDGKTFATLFEKRQSGDYDDFVFCDKEMFDGLYPKAESFVSNIKNLIENS